MSKKLFFRLTLAVFVGLTAVACSQDDAEPSTVEAQQISEDGMYHYQMQLDCAMPSFDTNGQTRAVSYDKWENNHVLNIRFKNGSSWIVGQATYSKAENIWNVGTYSTLPTTTGEETCEVYYFYQARGTSSTQISMNEQTACYMTKKGTYSHPTANSVSMRAVLDKMTWRLRFKGTAGTTITLPSSDNDINFFSALNLSTGNFTSGKKDVSLTVASDGYTPYIYGAFTSSNSNTITVTTDNTYSRTLSTSDLGVGVSGCLASPNSSNYSQLGWKPKNMNPVANCRLLVLDMVKFTHGIVTDWTIEDNVKQSYVTVFNESRYNQLKDNEKALGDEIISDNTPRDFSGKVTTFHDDNWFTANTNYVLCTVSLDANGNRGQVVAVPFKTLADNLPVAVVSNVTASTYQGNAIWMWNVSMKNGAKSYYIFNTDNDELYNETNDYFSAWLVHYYITSGQLTTTLDYENPYISRNSDHYTVVTWGLDSSKTIGDFSIGKSGYTGGKAPAKRSQSVANVKPVPVNTIKNSDLMNRVRTESHYLRWSW